MRKHGSVSTQKPNCKRVALSNYFFFFNAGGISLEFCQDDVFVRYHGIINMYKPVAQGVLLVILSEGLDAESFTLRLRRIGDGVGGSLPKKVSDAAISHSCAHSLPLGHTLPLPFCVSESPWE